jgi:hypothetical protein
MRCLRMLAGALLLAMALPASPVAVAAQQVPPDTVLTPEQRALQRLRGLGAVGEPDTLRAPADTIRAQQVRVSGATGRTAAPSSIERDSVMRLLLTVPDYVATEYRSDAARFNADSSRLELRGDAQVAREGSQLVADSLIVYDERLARACGYGQPVLHAVGMTHPLVSDTVCFNVARQIGWALGAETTFEEGATWHLRGEVLVFQGDDLYSHRAIFSDCDLPFPHKHYHFGAGSVKVVRDNVLVARDVTLNFQDVPVFWLPFMVQSLSRGRRSGLLMPRFGINDIARTSARYSRRIEDVGVYWAVNEYLGAQLALDWFSDNWTGLRGSFDYNFADRFLRGGLTYSQFWKQEGGRDFTLSTQNSWTVDERTAVSLNANYTTSSAFVRERTFDPRELNRSIDSQASFRRRFDWGNLSLGSSRRQFLSDNTVNWTLPSMQLSFSPVTLFEALPGEESWYSNANWQGGVDLRMDRQDIGELNLNPGAQSNRLLTTSARSNLTVGRFSLGQNFSFDDQQRDERTLDLDTAVVVPGSALQRGRWGTSLNFQQRLIGTSTLTPGISLGGEFQRSPQTDNELVSAPMRVDFNAALRTELYGFWPGVGPFERFRHKIVPSFSYNYSPAATADSLQRAVFSVAGVREQNRVSMGLSQSFEGRRRAVVTEPGTGAAAAPRRMDDPGDVGADDPQRTAGERQAVQDAAQPDTATGPRRREQVAPVTLLSLSTSMLVYDFVEAREGDGLMTTQISSSVQSDLLRGLQLSFSHDLFRPGVMVPGDTLAGTLPFTGGREFAPHLSQVNASFSLSSDSWIFRALRLGRADGPAREHEGAPGHPEEDVMEGGPPVDGTRSEFGMIGTSRRLTGGQRGAVGSWNASFNFSLDRPRDTGLGGRGNQMVTTNFNYQPTENWGLRWSTGYSFTRSQFTDHILSLTRTLHDWDASFDFVKAQNGNFSFQFRVHLRANPDIKLDYSQSDAQGIRQVQERAR